MKESHYLLLRLVDVEIGSGSSKTGMKRGKKRRTEDVVHKIMQRPGEKEAGNNAEDSLDLT